VSELSSSCERTMTKDFFEKKKPLNFQKRKKKKRKKKSKKLN